ncbi:hypothetical protein [Piscirickettsia salmonis]|uniref:hypothetical protein n=1 Tax=Piscirickettsia salmonis TaxID=1238 RepID=UPI0012BA6A9B|nr:hypothetical protein [Piscirickettsia salmonis]
MQQLSQEGSCDYTDDDSSVELLLNTADGLAQLKKELQKINTSTGKQAAFVCCKNLRELCFIASIRQKGGILHPKHTTTTGNALIDLLNGPDYDVLRREICPEGAKVRMRDIRSYARDGTKSTSGYFLNALDNNNEMFFSYAKNEHPTEPMLLFNTYIEQSCSAAASHGVLSTG